MSPCRRQSPAKINLTLRVGPPRPDGFHEVESLVARVGLCDFVAVRPRSDGRLTLECDDPALPRGPANLALRAAGLLARRAATRPGAHITLTKRIPPGAGLAGGSSNAATTLMLLNELWCLGLPPAELAALGARIGSDVPLFFHHPLCVVRGRGERVEDVRCRLPGWAVLVLPDIRCATRDVYAAWDEGAGPPPRPTVQDVLQRAAGSSAGPTGAPSEVSADALMPLLFNDLEAAALALNPALRELAGRLARLSGGTARLTGSGSGFFRLFAARRAAAAFAQRVTEATRQRVEVVPLASR